MKKSVAIIIVFILVILGIGGYWFYFGRGGGGGAGGGAGEGGGEEQGFIGKIADALKVGTAMRCSWNAEVVGGGSASFYLKSGKLRGEVTVGDDKMEYIISDNCYYYWGEEENEGIKWCWDPAEASDWEESMQASAETYNCQPAAVSDSMFSPPSGINFVDMSEYMQYTP